MNKKKGYGLGYGYGKIILFGEHFVVHGSWGIASALKNMKTVLRIKESNLWKSNWNLNKKLLESIKNITRSIGIKKKFDIKILREVPPKENLGASASFCVAFSRALNDLYSLNLKDSDINRIAYEGEKAFHGTPSGIDNTASTLGTMFLFKKTKKGMKIKGLKPKKSLHMLVIKTGKKIGDTKVLVEKVRKRKEEEGMYDEVMKLYQRLLKKALNYLSEGNVKGLGKLMDINHGLLTSFNLTTPKLEEVREAVEREGALGSKMTGAGKGGNVIALFSSKEKAISAGKAIKKKFASFYTKLG